MKKYCVTVARTGAIFVEAEDASEAMYIADHQNTEAVSWTDDWEATDCIEDESVPSNYCIRDCAF